MRWLVLVVIVPVIAAAPAVRPKSIKPVINWTGTDSKVAKESFARCSSQKEWEVTWLNHQADKNGEYSQKCPEVDFDSCMVIAVFHGKSYENTGIEVLAVNEDRDCVRVRYRPATYQVAFSFPPVTFGESAGESPKQREGGGEKTLKRPYDTQSYVFIVLPKSPKPVILEEDLRDRLDGPSVWYEQAKLLSEKK